MNLEEYHTLFIASSLTLMLIAASPALSMIISVPRTAESFSELWVLGPNHMTEDYPFDIRANETHRVFVGMGNHLGYSAYYLVYAKFRNGTQPLPAANTSSPSPLPTLYEFRVFLADGETWEGTLSFAIEDASLFRFNRTFFIRRLLINGCVFSVNCPSMWNQKYRGFYYQLFLELWLYNMTTRNFRYHNRYVGIWLNMTI